MNNCNIVFFFVTYFMSKKNISNFISKEKTTIKFMKVHLGHIDCDNEFLYLACYKNDIIIDETSVDCKF